MNKKNKNLFNNIGILGYGEVGRAVAQFYNNPRQNFSKKNLGGQAKIKDLDRDDGLKGVEVLNVCIPWSNNFISIIEQEIKEIRPKLAIIHSTVAPGTTKELSSKFQGMVVHSPVRGIHPHLYEGIKTFVKYIGADDEEAGNLAKKHLDSLGIENKVFQPSITTEIGKLFSTTYYGLCIAWHGEMKRMCGQLGVDFEKAVTEFNKTYNQGYPKLGKDNVVRPVLYPPESGIKGHCVGSNNEILKKHFNSLALDLIFEYKPKKETK